MKPEEFNRFAELLVKIWTASKNAQGKESPEPDLVEFYFAALQDMELADIRQNALIHYRTNKGGWFPSIAELRQSEDPEVKAINDLRILKDLVDSYCGAGFGQSGMNAVKIRLESMKRTDLLPLLREFSNELCYDENPTATRAQFIKAHKAIEARKENNKLLAEHEKNKQLPIDSKVKELFNGSIKSGDDR